MNLGLAEKQKAEKAIFMFDDSLGKVVYYEDLKHGLRVGQLARKVAQAMGLKNYEEIYKAGTMHDIGKAFLNQKILTKSEKLTREEYEHIKLHVLYSVREVKKLGYGENIVQAIRYHHENYNGAGYFGLCREEIPMEAAIIRICDTYDAIRMVRPYKKASTKEAALEEIIKCKSLYHPKVLEVFLKLHLQEE